MRYLLDTCTISELVKRGEPDQGVLEWLGQQEEERLFLSAITLGEIQAGISKLPEAPRRLQLATWLDADLRQRFSGRILAFDAEVALVWGTKRGELASKGVLLPVADSLIAATAIAHGMVVVTRNERDLRLCGAMTVNPWKG